MKLLLPVLCWVVALATGARLPEQRESARLLLRKTVANPVVVANKDFAVHYEIINTGTRFLLAHTADFDIAPFSQYRVRYCA